MSAFTSILAVLFGTWIVESDALRQKREREEDEWRTNVFRHYSLSELTAFVRALQSADCGVYKPADTDLASSWSFARRFNRPSLVSGRWVFMTTDPKAGYFVLCFVHGDKYAFAGCFRDGSGTLHVRNITSRIQYEF